MIVLLLPSELVDLTGSETRIEKINKLSTDEENNSFFIVDGGGLGSLAKPPNAAAVAAAADNDQLRPRHRQ